MAKSINRKVPSYDSLIIPTLKALKQLGGSGRNEEIDQVAIRIAKIPESILEILHGNGPRTEVGYRLGWSRTYLRKAGLITNSARGVWALKDSKIIPDEVNVAELVKKVQAKHKREKITKQKDEDILEQSQDSGQWKDELIEVLLNMRPDAFERLCKRLLRESGFIEVEVTQPTRDKGIDGRGIMKVNGLISFPVAFQAKRYRGGIAPKEIQSFRGAMEDGEKGIFITTGTFSKKAIEEAKRKPVSSIDLIDGNMLCEKLKELQLGVETKLVETVEIKPEWFKDI